MPDVGMSLRTAFAVAGAVGLIMAACGAGYALIATFATWRFVRRAGQAALRYPSISVLKPLHGAEPELYENLLSFCSQAYAGSVQIVLGVQDPADPALSVALRVKAEH